MPSKKLALPDQEIDTLIREIRGQKVILDTDLARVYGIETRSTPPFCVPQSAFRLPAAK